MTNPRSESQKSQYKKWSKTQEADHLRRIEESMGIRLDGIAFFLANNPPIKKRK